MSWTVAVWTFAAAVAALIALWLYSAKKELQKGFITAQNAKKQLLDCRKSRLLAKSEAETAQAKQVLARSRDIYRQSVQLYNSLLTKPKNRIPALLLGFRPIKK